MRLTAGRVPNSYGLPWRTTEYCVSNLTDVPMIQSGKLPASCSPSAKKDSPGGQKVLLGKQLRGETGSKSDHTLIARETRMDEATSLPEISAHAIVLTGERSDETHNY
jgi:hypothetical protein